MTRLLHFLFFCSGFSGLIYQVVWIRVFGNVFGNTIYSASVIVAVFMLGLGVGSYIVGAWADRRYLEWHLDSWSPVPTERPATEAHFGRRASRSGSLLRAYGCFELLIGLMGFAVAALLPDLGQLSAMVSSYSRDGEGWYVLSTASYLAHGSIAMVLLAPITLLMGGTLTLLIRYRVGGDLEAGGWRIAVLYTVNTAGAALGCFLTDFALVPAYGLGGAQIVAVLFNIVAAAGALGLASWRSPVAALPGGSSERRTVSNAAGLQPAAAGQSAVAWTSAALALSGFAAMGVEILWFRHFSILLGEFRAVFSLLLTVILVGIGAGSLIGGALSRRTARPAEWLIVAQGLFITSTLLGLAAADAEHIRDAAMAIPGYTSSVGNAPVGTAWVRAFHELWFNARPILVEVGLPALLMGFAFPVANAVVQRMEPFVARRAGLLYLSNTVGAVSGSLASGFLLLPMLGIQRSATILMIAAGIGILPLHMASRRLALDEFSTSRTIPARRGASRRARVRPTEAAPRRHRLPVFGAAGSTLLAAVALGSWVLLPSAYAITRALVLPTHNERLLTVSEGITEVIAVVDVPGRGRMLLTNGHPMSSTDLLSQRYMRALAHIPLLSIDNPENVLVMCFGVGNTAHAATLHPSVRRVEVVDLSRHVLVHSEHFRHANRDVLKDPRVTVYVNDGRHHLQMHRETFYELITLEPPPITHAGVGALYSREFYASARMRLKPKGYMSQWLPVAGVPAATTLAMVRAFVDVFPQSVLLSGAHTNLLLVGVNDSRIEIDPVRVAAALSNAPAVQADLRRLDLGSVREIVGAFVASAQTLARATRDSSPATDDHPVQEYGVRSLLKFGEAPPASIVDLRQVVAWCPKCFSDGQPVPLVDGLDTYLALLDLVYQGSPADMRRAPVHPDVRPRVIAGSAYLGAVIPESADLHNVLGAALAAKGHLEEAIAEFREGLRLDPDSATAHWNLGRVLAAPEAALPHLRRSVALDPRNGQARYRLATVLLESRQYDDALEEFGAALRLMPDSVEIRNNLGVTLASQGNLDAAIDQFRQALTLQPDFADARRNLTIALEKQRRLVPSARR